MSEHERWECYNISGRTAREIKEFIVTTKRDAIEHSEPQTTKHARIQKASKGNP